MKFYKKSIGFFGSLFVLFFFVSATQVTQVHAFNKFKKLQAEVEILNPQANDVINPTMKQIPISISYLPQRVEIVAGSKTRIIPTTTVRSVAIFVNDEIVSWNTERLIREGGTINIPTNIAQLHNGPIEVYAALYLLDADTMKRLFRIVSRRSFKRNLLFSPVAVSKKETFIVESYSGFVIPPSESDVIINSTGQQLVKNQILVSFDDTVTQSIAESVAKEINGIISGFFPSINTYQYTIEAQNEVQLDRIINFLESRSYVESAYKNYAIHFSEINAWDIDNLRSNDSNCSSIPSENCKAIAYDKVSLQEAWKTVGKHTTQSVKIGVVDSGVNENHIEFQDVSIKRHYFFPPGKTLAQFLVAHGTKVTGIIGADNKLGKGGALANDSPEMNGVISGVTNDYMLFVYPLPTLHQLFSFQSAVLDGLEKLADDGAKVINVSMGERRCVSINGSTRVPCTPTKDFNKIIKTFEKFYKKHDNVLFVNAAGNDGMNAENIYPAAANADNEITVGATDIHDTRAVWSNYGEVVEVSAPGEHIYTPSGSGTLSNVSYDNNFGGTSGAAPIVSGIAGMLFALDDKMTPQRFKKIISDPINGSSVSTDSDKPIGNRIDAKKAVCAVIDCIGQAVNLPYKVTDAILGRDVSQVGEVFFDDTFNLNYKGEEIYLSSSEDGSQNFVVDDELQIKVTHEDGSTTEWSHDFSGNCTQAEDTLIPSVSISHLFSPGENKIQVTMKDKCGAFVWSSTLWLTEKESKLVSDHFEGNSLNSDMWKSYLNGGSINVSDSFVTVSTETINTFPYIHTKTNPIPTTEDFSAKVVFQYLSANRNGNGIVLDQGIPENGHSNYESPSVNTAFAIWQDRGPNPVQNKLRVYVGNNIVWTTTNVDFDPHTVLMKYSDGKASVSVDGGSYSEPVAIGRPTSIWFGNPARAGVDSWSSFKIDEIKVSQPPEEYQSGFLDTFHSTTLNQELYSIKQTGNTQVAPFADGLHLKLNGNNTIDTFGASLITNFLVKGNFEATIDYHLIAWPDHNGARLGLGAKNLGSVDRVSFTEVDHNGEDNYLTHFAGQYSPTGFTPTTDQFGKLKLERSGNTLSGYYFNNGNWVLIDSTTASTNDVTLTLALWSHGIEHSSEGEWWGNQDVEVVLENFKVIPNPL